MRSSALPASACADCARTRGGCARSESGYCVVATIPVHIRQHTVRCHAPVRLRQTAVPDIACPLPACVVSHGCTHPARPAPPPVPLAFLPPSHRRPQSIRDHFPSAHAPDSTVRPRRHYTCGTTGLADRFGSHACRAASVFPDGRCPAPAGPASRGSYADSPTPPTSFHPP